MKYSVPILLLCSFCSCDIVNELHVQNNTTNSANVTVEYRTHFAPGEAYYDNDTLHSYLIDNTPANKLVRNNTTDTSYTITVPGKTIVRLYPQSLLTPITNITIITNDDTVTIPYTENWFRESRQLKSNGTVTTKGFFGSRMFYQINN